MASSIKGCALDSDGRDAVLQTPSYSDDEANELIDEAVEAVKDIDKKIKSQNNTLQRQLKLIEKQHGDAKICPLFSTSWHPNDFCEEVLDFSSLTMAVILNPDSQTEPKSFEEGALMYYDAYFANLTTFSIPTVESFKATKPEADENNKNSKSQKKIDKKAKRRSKNSKRESQVASAVNGSDNAVSLSSMNVSCAKRRDQKIDHAYRRMGEGEAGNDEILERKFDALTIEEAQKKRKLHHIPDDELNEDVSEDVIAERKGKRANKIVASILEKWGVENGVKMMIMTELKFQKFNEDGKLSSYNGDFDVFAITQPYGIIFIQVKGVQGKDGGNADSTCGKIQTARRQVLKDVTFFRESNRDLSFVFDVPVHTFIALPNMTERELDIIDICQHHRHSILCSSDMEDISHFDVWMKTRLSGNCTTGENLSEANYRRLCSRYLALSAKIDFPSRAVVIKKTKGIVSAVQCGKEGNLWAILTPDQLKAIYDQESLKLITGEFGTGKSLVVVTKAKQLAMNDCVVYIITFAGVGTDVNCYHNTTCFSIEQLKRMMGEVPENIEVRQVSDIIRHYEKSDTKDWTAITVELLEDLFDLISKEHSETTVHFLLDEVPCYLFESCHQALINFPRTHKDSCLWLVLATHSHKNNQFLLSDTHWFQAMMQVGFSFTRLVSSMRFPANVYEMVQILRGNEDPISAKLQRLGHVVDGPKPLVFIMPKCKCTEDSHRKSIFLCSCLLERMRKTVEKMFQILDPTGKAIDCSEYSILIGCFVGTSFQHDLCTNLREAFRSDQKELMFNLTAPATAKLPSPNASGEKFEKVFNVYDRYTYIGCENSIVIDIDPYSLHQCGVGNQWTYATMPFTRTVSQYVLFTWPKDEAYRLWTSDLQGHDKLTEERVRLGQITEEMRDIRYKMTAAARISRGECLDKLIASNAVLVHQL